jgi:energy-coupling factor transporter ATP-binding protein EcfA2
MASTKGESRASRLSFDSVNSDVRETRSPSLVSFVGQSGAGKSTLINLLVTFKSSGMSNETFPAPVVGMTGKDVPTSEDVHLYADPETVASDTPLLFADCEGLEGGEREPVGSRYRKSRIEGGRTQDRTTYPTPKAQYSSERQIVWADTPAKRTRQFAVTNLYPRLLYTFSDTIVFVLKNPRVIESVFERLIEWAAAALETSSNQPMLPCAIITLNASETNIAPELWDVESGTNNLLESLAQTVHSNSCFQKFAQFWNDRSTKITTLKDLVLCYYSSIQIVRIPAAGRPKLMKEQCEKLYTGIVQGCAAARKLKQSLRLLLNATELQSYLQYAFDHFAHTLDEPFDFVQASFVSNPIPMDFGGSILRLAISMMEHQIGQADAFSIFQQLGSMVASCIMLDSVRHQIRGRLIPYVRSHADSRR